MEEFWILKSWCNNFVQNIKNVFIGKGILQNLARCTFDAQGTKCGLIFQMGLVLLTKAH